MTYWYAWKGGPRLRGEPRTPDFVTSYHEAHEAKIAAPEGALVSLTRYFEEVSELTDLAERTKADYRKHIAAIEKDFGDLPLAALDDKRTRGVFKDWRDRLAKKSKRQADYAGVVPARILSVAKDRGKNPCEKGGRLYHGSRRDMVWSLDDEKAYLDAAPAHMRLPPLLWPLKAALDGAAKQKRSPLILTTKSGRAWTEDGFRASWRKVCTNAGIDGLTFHDLRGTAVTRLAIAKCTEAEIAIFTGLSLAGVRENLDRHYLNRDPAIADSAGAKLAKVAESGTKLPTGQTGKSGRTAKAE